jgi:hypothetical protein
MLNRKKEQASRYTIPQKIRYKLTKDCKHYVDKMVGGKDSMLVTGVCKKCGVRVYQDRVSWMEEKKRRGL